LALGLAVALGVMAAAARAAVPEPDGFRMDHYRGPVPDSLRGASVVTTAQLQDLLRTGHPLLIDVLPAPSPPPDDRPGLPRLPMAHRDIPGSLWLPDTGRGALSPATEEWFRAELRRATGGDRGKPMVFYCLSQCWMSWNAARRAVLWGYTRVVWYPDGADGWERAGQATEVAHAERQ
jgi:PQQ-dependent catabolism-associated CXXCW motif protein